MDNEHDIEPQQPSEPTEGQDADSSPFESPSFEKVEKGIDGPWEKRDDE